MKRVLFLIILILVYAAVTGAESQRKDISIQQRMIVLESDGSRLKVNELYTVETNSASSRTKIDVRSLKIYLPDGATVEQATARSEGIKSLKTTVVPESEKNRYAFTYPVRSGKTQFTVTYTLAYNGQLRINPRITAATAQLVVVAPDTMHLVPEDDSVLVPANDPMLKNVTVHVAGDVTPQVNLAFEIQGSGSLARSQQQGRPPAPARKGLTETANNSQEGAAQQRRPAGDAAPQWIFLAVLLLFLAAGATYVYSVNHAVSPSPAAPSLLAEMKDEMFRLESERLQGKLSPEEYEAAKAALDRAMQKIL